MQIEYLVERQEQVVAMSDGQANELKAVGKRLAKEWWGDEDGPQEHSVLSCNPKGPGEWSVRVNDNIGMIATGGLQLIVQPKIPIPHLLYLFGESGHFPSLDTERIRASAGDSLLELVAEWFVTAMEIVLRQGLIRDYRDTTESIPFVRGRLDVPDATRTHLLGRTSFLCHFEEFGFDTPLNRVLKNASQIVMANQTVKLKVRKRATRIANRLDEAGNLRPSDTQSSLERKSGHYRNAYLLAKHVIQGCGRYLDQGDTPSWTFLIRTPEMVENGLLKVLKDRCSEWVLRKRQIPLWTDRVRLTTSMILNPDIVVGDKMAVADVKYKLGKDNWNKNDFNQVVTFAAGAHAQFGAVVDFRTPGTAPLPAVQVGDIQVVELTWPADPKVPPNEAASQLANSFSAWLRGLHAA